MRTSTRRTGRKRPVSRHRTAAQLCASQLGEGVAIPSCPDVQNVSPSQFGSTDSSPYRLNSLDSLYSCRKCRYISRSDRRRVKTAAGGCCRGVPHPHDSVSPERRSESNRCRIDGRPISIRGEAVASVRRLPLTTTASRTSPDSTFDYRKVSVLAGTGRDRDASLQSARPALVATDAVRCPFGPATASVLDSRPGQ